MMLETRERTGLVVMLALLLVCASLLLTVLGMPELFVAAPEPEPEPIELAATPEPTPEHTPTPEPTPQLRERTELLTLVNPWHELPEDWETELQLVNDDGEGQYIDVRCADALLQMIADCAEAGNDPYICSGYRTMEKQQYLFNNKIARLVAAGTDPEDAPTIAAQSVAIPGTSEHQLGLAADIIDLNYPYLDEGQEETSTQKWLMENSWKYGFILRYPNGSSDITGIIYEPWHYRYVGLDAAKEIYDLGVTLEEYLDMFYEPID